MSTTTTYSPCGPCCGAWYCVDTGAGCPGEALFLTPADIADTGITKCSGPYASEAAALVDCASTVVTSCSSNPIPKRLRFRFTYTNCPAQDLDLTLVYDATCGLWYNDANVRSPSSCDIYFQCISANNFRLGFVTGAFTCSPAPALSLTQAPTSYSPFSWTFTGPAGSLPCSLSCASGGNVTWDVSPA